ncbi:MAG: OadG family protein [Betaproteobacteria bacterium]|nr:OadG family protein [Betaproteobacteria bacterium]
MNNLGWGLQMTMLGMGLVFGLLALLWAMLVIVLRFDSEPAAVGAGETTADAAPAAVGPDAPATVATIASVNGMDADLVAAILVATLRHKEVRRAQAAPAMRSYWPGSLLYASRWVASGRSRQNHVWERRPR